MKHSHLALCLLLLLSDAVSQSPNPKQPPTRTPATTPTPAPNPDGQINDRRAQARSLLASLATDARKSVSVRRTMRDRHKKRLPNKRLFHSPSLSRETTDLFKPERTHSNSTPERYVKYESKSVSDSSVPHRNDNFSGDTVKSVRYI